jgi:hypothetical protein
MITRANGPDDRTPPAMAPFRLRLAIVLFLFLSGLFYMYLLFDAWSGDLAIPRFIFRVSDEFSGSELFQSFMMAAAGGGLGGVIYSILAFHRHVSIRQDFSSAYAWGFFLSPWVAMVLGDVVFALIQGGLLVFATGTPSATALADMGYFGLGFLAGFGWNSVTEKLRELINQLFGGSPDRIGLSPEIAEALKQFAKWQNERMGSPDAPDRAAG